MSDYRVKLISGPSSKRYSGLVRSLKPLRYYRLDETSGTVAIDAMGVANGLYMGSPTLNQNPLITEGKSVLFDGIDDRVSVTNLPSIVSEITVCFWFSVPAIPAELRYMFGIRQGLNWLLSTINANGTISVRTCNATNIYSMSNLSTIVPNKTYFLVFKRDSSGTRTVYLNNEKIAESNIVEAWTPTTPDLLTIGTYQTPGGGFFFPGTIDEFAVFNKPLTNLQIGEMYEEGFLGPLQEVAELVNARVTSVEFEKYSKGVGRVTLPTPDIGVQGIKTKGRREIQIWRNDRKIAEGPVWTIWGDSKNSFINVEPLSSYFAKRHIESTKEYTNTDIYTILWDLIDDTQTEKGTLGITASNFLPVGINRDAKYPADEHANIGDLLLDFPEVEWAIEIYDDGRREWTPYYPGRGEIRVSDKLEWGGFVVDYRYSYHSTESATSVIWNGKGSGPDKAEGSYHDSALSDLNVYLSKIRTDHHVTDPDILNAMSEQLVKKIGIDEVLPDLKITNNPLEPDYDFVGSIKVGDVFPVYLVHDDRVLVDGLFRITKFVLDPQEDAIWATIEEYHAG